MYAAPAKKYQVSARSRASVAARAHPSIRNILRGSAVQPKLKIGATNDPAEAEADRVADRVMRMPVPASGEGTVMANPGLSSGPNPIRRMCAGCEDEVQRMTSGEGPEIDDEEFVQAKEAPGATPALSAGSESAIRGLGGGAPLAAAERSFFEPRFGRDFSKVRLHTDAKAASMADSIQAKAFTLGNDIAFAKGAYNPESSSGKHLLAHELTHTVQQRGGFENGTLQRQENSGSETKYTGSVGSISWIDSGSPAGKRVSDPRPPNSVKESFITGSSGFRFSNFLKASVKTKDGKVISGSSLGAASGIYTSPSFLGIPSKKFAIKRSQKSIVDKGIEGVEFDQTVGARTISAGVAGGAVGTGVGIGGGAYLGGKIGSVFGLPGILVGAVIGGGLGYLTGTATANRVTNFPPIWTHIRVKIFANGKQLCSVQNHSYFPSSNYYCNLKQFKNYNALASEQTTWEKSGWNKGNPWNVSRPLITP